MDQNSSALPPVDIPCFRQPGKHDMPALAHALSDVVEAFVTTPRLVYHVSAVTPDTFEALQRSSTSPLTVSTLYCDYTIFGDPLTNIKQRLWHDLTHIRLEAGFDLAGESRVARAQAYDVACLTGDILADWVFADIYAQAWHMAHYGSFPTPQATFTHEVIRTGRIPYF